MNNEELIKLLSVFGVNLSVGAITLDGTKHYQVTGIRKIKKDSIELILDQFIDKETGGADEMFLKKVNDELNDEDKIDIDEAILAKKQFTIDLNSEFA